MHSPAATTPRGTPAHLARSIASRSAFFWARPTYRSLPFTCQVCG